ncbi:CheY-like chemotaxis protein [Rhizobium sp. PvP014]|nr:CheY-like chemotaxis protein [Rhizobium sp. PvP014]MBP2527883.1 CheY-like chemotaxis protein [Rhizobium sp. PvP099]
MKTSEFAKLSEPIALVVDDEPLVLMDTADIISEEGYAVVEARTADEA